jgi:hypothetical protein
MDEFSFSIPQSLSVSLSLSFCLSCLSVCLVSPSLSIKYLTIVLIFLFPSFACIRHPGSKSAGFGVALSLTSVSPLFFDDFLEALGAGGTSEERMKLGHRVVLIASCENIHRFNDSCTVPEFFCLLVRNNLFSSVRKASLDKRVGGIFPQQMHLRGGLSTSFGTPPNHHTQPCTSDERAWMSCSGERGIGQRSSAFLVVTKSNHLPPLPFPFPPLNFFLSQLSSISLSIYL